MPSNYNSNPHKPTRLDSYQTNDEKSRVYEDFMKCAGCGPFNQIRVSGRGPCSVSIIQRGKETNEHTIRTVKGSFEFDRQSQAAGKAKELIENYLSNASDHGRIEGDADICDDWVYKLLSWVIAEGDEEVLLVTP